MNKSIKYLNFIIFTILLIVFFIFNTQKSISTNILTILPDGDNKELLKKFENLHNTKLLFVGYKDFDKNTLDNLKKIEKQLLKNQNIKKLTKNKLIEEYEKRYYYLTNQLDTKKLEKLNIQRELRTLYQQIVASPFSFQIDTKDPLNIFKKNSSVKTLYLNIKEYGYITILQVDNSIDTMEEYQELYNFTKNIQAKDNNIELFSTLFYYVESQNKIKSDTNTIIFIAIFILVILYLLILRNIRLLLNTLITLGSSILFALILTVWMFGELSIFSVIFGISISTIAIDYMFHNYMHNFYGDKKSINKSVFYGMITTVGAFFILSFCEFKLIEQLSFFAILSLIFSYLQFTFIYPYLYFAPSKSTFKYPKTIFIKPIYITLTAFVFITFSLFNIEFDLDIKNLDVQNTKLQQLDEFFTTQINSDKKIAVLISGNTLKELIENTTKLTKKYPDIFTNLTKIPVEEDYKKLEQYDLYKLNQELNKIASKVGFRKNMFQDSYKVDKTLPQYNFEQLQEFGISHYKTKFISYLVVSSKNYNEIVQEAYVKSLSVKELFQNDLKNSINNLQILASLTIFFIMAMLYLAVKNNFFKALNYILFPLGMIGFLSYFIEFNILHIFMIVVIVSISIDYGIYMNNNSIDTQTQKAILYSLLSTFAGFGVLIFSSLTALFSIGVVATIGIIAIMILLLVQNNLKEEN